MKSSSTSTKFIGLAVASILGLLIALALFVFYHRNLNAKLEVCVSQIELGDSRVEVIEKMKPYRKKPDRILENQTIYYKQEKREGFTVVIYDALFGDSGDYIFYFPPNNDTLILHGPE